MKAREVMTAPAITVGPDATFAEISDLLLTRHVSGLPVVDGGGHLLGVVSESDLISKEAYGPRRARWAWLLLAYLRGRDPRWVRKAGGRRAADVMTAAPVTVAPDDDVDVAARRLLETGCNRLPVVEGGRVVGVVARQDLLKPYDRTDDAIAAEVSLVLHDPMRTPASHAVHAEVSGGVVALDGTALHPSDVRVIEAVLRRVPGVIAVDSHVVARDAEPDERSA